VRGEGWAGHLNMIINNDCLHCATNAAIAISGGETVWCPGCKKNYRPSTHPGLVVTRHPSLAEAEQALKALSKRRGA
jgi:hypothetical protein